MKKLVLLIALVFILSNVFSQGSRIKGGVRAGATTSQISGDDLSGFHKLGGYAGVYANIPFTKDEKWKFQMEINFIMKGSSLFAKGANNPNMYRKYTLNLFYLEVPFLAKFNLVKGLEVELGPTVNFLFASREVNEGGVIMGRPPFRFYEISILGGFSYYFNDHWAINLRYTNSIIPVRIPTWVYDRVVSKQFNSAFALSGIYQF